MKPSARCCTTSWKTAAGPAAQAEIKERFGERVEAIVVASSDSLTGEEVKAPWRERKQAYIAPIARK